MGNLIRRVSSTHQRRCLTCIRAPYHSFLFLLSSCTRIRWTLTLLIKWIFIGLIINPILVYYYLHIGGNVKNGVFAFGRLYCPGMIRKSLGRYSNKRIVPFLAWLLTQILSFLFLYLWSYSSSSYTSLLNVLIMIPVDSIAYLTKMLLICARLTSREN